MDQLLRHHHILMLGTEYSNSGNCTHEIVCKSPYAVQYSNVERCIQAKNCHEVKCLKCSTLLHPQYPLLAEQQQVLSILHVRSQALINKQAICQKPILKFPSYNFSWYKRDKSIKKNYKLCSSYLCIIKKSSSCIIMQQCYLPYI